MATVRSEITNDFTQVYLTASSASMNTLYPVMLVYLGNIHVYTSAVGGTATIGGTTYTTSAGVTDLNFEAVVTLNGTEYQEIITPSFLGLTSTILPEGVYSFKLLDASEVADLEVGVLSYAELRCCMATKLNNAYITCSPHVMTLAEKEVVIISALLDSARESVAIQDMINANKKFTIASKMCANCGCN